MKYFPLFVSLQGKKVVVVGAGVIACRRIKALLEFMPEIFVIAPQLHPDLVQLEEDGLIQWIPRCYESGDIACADLALAATSSREVNRQVGQDARRRGIPVNVADCKAECDFYFPGLAVSEELVIGITASGSDHKLVKRAVQQIRKWLEERGEHNGKTKMDRR